MVADHGDDVRIHALTSGSTGLAGSAGTPSRSRPPRNVTTRPRAAALRIRLYWSLALAHKQRARYIAGRPGAQRALAGHTGDGGPPGEQEQERMAVPAAPGPVPVVPVVAGRRHAVRGQRPLSAYRRDRYHATGNGWGRDLPPAPADWLRQVRGIHAGKGLAVCEPAPVPQ